MSEQGRKYDGGKLRYDLIPVLALEEMVKGLTFGTNKYDDNNWVKVPNGRKRYLAAALRHIQEYRKGNLWDEEQDIHHLAAAMNNLSFIVEKDMRGWEDSSEEGIPREDFSEKEILTFKNPFGGKDISQEELKKFVQSVDNHASQGNVPETQEELWYPPVEEGENPWIEYDGSGQPVEDYVQVQWLNAGERISKTWVSVEACSSTLNWGRDTLVAYRIVD